MDFKEVLNYFNFKETKTIKYDKKLYRLSVSGWNIENDAKCIRNIKHYKLFAIAFPDCALPYTRYFLVDTKENKVYTTELQQYLSPGKDIIDRLSKMHNY